MATFTAFTYAELSSRFPLSAGEAIYIENGFNRNRLSIATGFLVVDLALMVMRTEHCLDLSAVKFQIEAPRPGDEVLVVGNPLDIAGMLARVRTGFIEQAREGRENFGKLKIDWRKGDISDP